MSGNPDGKKKGDVAGRPFAAMFRQCRPDANSATACISRSLILDAI
jgi:hypothetical protein